MRSKDSTDSLQETGTLTSIRQIVKKGSIRQIKCLSLSMRPTVSSLTLMRKEDMISDKSSKRKSLHLQNLLNKNLTNKKRTKVISNKKNINSRRRSKSQGSLAMRSHLQMKSLFQDLITTKTWIPRAPERRRKSKRHHLQMCIATIDWKNYWESFEKSKRKLKRIFWRLKTNLNHLFQAKHNQHFLLSEIQFLKVS